MLIIDSGATSWDEKPPESHCPEDDWDTLIIFPVIDAASLLAAHQLYDKGSSHADYSSMYVADRTFSELKCGTGYYRGQVTYKGILDDTRPIKYHLESYGERSTYDDTTSPNWVGPPGAPHDISVPRIGLTAKYLLDTLPDTSEVGTNVAPPISLWEPTNAFSSSTDVVIAYPDGWVLEKRTGPNIPGTDTWMVEDVYVFYQPWRPNG